MISSGSFFHLNPEKCPDNLSDLDIIIFTCDIGKYSNQNKTEWTSSFPGKVLSVYIQKNNYMTNARILFNDFLCIDLTIVDKKLLLISRTYIQSKKIKIFNFFLKKVGGINNFILTFSYYISSGYKIIYGHNKIHSLVNEISKNFVPLTTAFNEEAFKINYNGFWQICYKIYVSIKRDDMLYAILKSDNSLKRIIIELLIWREQLNPKKDSPIFRGKKIKYWGNDYYEQMKNDGLMFTLNIEEAYSKLLHNISFYKSISKDVNDYCLPDLEKSIISLLENEIRKKSI